MPLHITYRLQRIFLILDHMQMTVGVVYNPTLGHMYTAVRGRGAFLNGSPIRVSGCTGTLCTILIASLCEISKSSNFFLVTSLALFSLIRGLARAGVLGVWLVSRTRDHRRHFQKPQLHHQ